MGGERVSGTTTAGAEPQRRGTGQSRRGRAGSGRFASARVHGLTGERPATTLIEWSMS